MVDNELEKQIQEFARGFDYPPTPNIAKSLSRPAYHRQQKTLRVMAYAMGAVLMLAFSVFLLNRVDWNKVTTAPPATVTANKQPTFHTATTLPTYPAELGYPDYTLSYYDDIGETIILVWQKSSRPGYRPPTSAYQQTGFNNFPSYVLQQSLMSRNSYFRNPFNKAKLETKAYEQQMTKGDLLIWQVTRIPYYR